MYFSIKLDTTDTSSITRSFKFDNFVLNTLFLSSDSGPTCSPKIFLEIAKPEFMVLPPMFIAATPVGASGRTDGLSGSSGPCLYDVTFSSSSTTSNEDMNRSSFMGFF